MSIGDFWKFGVWHPFPNPHFRRPQRMVSSVASDYTAGVIIYTNASDLYFLASIRPGDVVRGISSYLGFEGRQFYATVKSVSSNSFMITEENSVKLKIGDPLTCWTTKVPEGFYTTSSINWNVQGIVHDALAYPFDNHHALKLSVANQSLESNYICTARKPLLLSTTYFSSVIYKASSIGNCRVFFFRNDGATLLYVPLSVSSQWAESHASGSTAQSSAEYNGRAGYDIYRSSGNDSGLMFKTIVLMHAAETSAQSDGVLTFNNLPRSISLSLVNPESRREILEDDQIYLKQGFQRSGLLRVIAQFSNVSQTTLDDLQALIDWQDQGNLLCCNMSLHTIPKWMIGTMEIRNVARELLTSEVSFTLLFEEKI